MDYRAATFSIVNPKIHSTYHILAIFITFVGMASLRTFCHSISHLLFLFAVIGLEEAISWPVMGAMAAKEGKEFGQ